MQLNTVAKRRHVKIQASIIYLQGRAESEFRTLGNYKLSEESTDDAMSFTSSDFQSVECRGGFKPNHALDGETFLDLKCCARCTCA